MKLKKTITILFFALFTSAVMPAFAGEPVKMTNEALTQQALNRISVIRNMDRSTLTKSQKKELRKELRQLKKESKEPKKNGIYLSVGAIIVIGVLLILLL